ncbi:unnamed protein product, partial [marine sediment metagenome]
KDKKECERLIFVSLFSFHINKNYLTKQSERKKLLKDQQKILDLTIDSF